MQRYYRSIKERIYLLSAQQSEEKFEFKVRGSSLNIYNQTLDPHKFKCSCPDHETRETFCKHLLFIVGKVAEQTTMARNLCVYQELWDEDHFTIISEDLVDFPGVLKASDFASEVTSAIAGTDNSSPGYKSDCVIAVIPPTVCPGLFPKILACVDLYLPPVSVITD